MRWPWERRWKPDSAPVDRPDTGGVVTSYTSRELARLVGFASPGFSGADGLAVAESCIGVWERAMSSSQVTPRNQRTSILTPAVLGSIGRALATRGECIFIIGLERGQLTLTPATSFDISGGEDPTSWMYRVDLQGPSSATSRVVSGAGVVHPRIAARQGVPWRGRSPLDRAGSTTAVARVLEQVLAQELAIPTGRILPAGGNSEQLRVYGSEIAAGGLTIASQNFNQEQTPSSRWTPQKIGPEPPAEVVDLRGELASDIVACYGLAGLFSGGDGAAQKEALRRAWSATLQPIARIIEAELRDKLDVPDLEISLDELRASDEQARSRAFGSRCNAVSRLVSSGVGVEKALRLAGLDDL